jgi:TPR repeat protein
VDLGHAYAQRRIGELYYQGLYGLHKDLTQAYVWYTLAANGGDDGAAEQVDLLIEELSAQQLSDARIKLEEWEPGQCERDLKEAIPEVDE